MKHLNRLNITRPAVVSKINCVLWWIIDYCREHRTMYRVRILILVMLIRSKIREFIWKHVSGDMFAFGEILFVKYKPQILANTFPFRYSNIHWLWNRYTRGTYGINNISERQIWVVYKNVYCSLNYWIIMTVLSVKWFRINQNIDLSAQFGC